MFDFNTRLEKGLAVLGLAITPDASARLSIYFSELKKWGKKVNLIAKSTSDEQIVENHFLDSLTILPLLEGVGIHLLDIGTGAGFPALVCKAACPELAVTLVEPRSKRVSFLGHIVRTLGLEGVNIIPCRIEEEEEFSSARSFTHITARAVTEIGPFLQMVERFAATGPQLICMKGPKWREELTAAADVLSSSSYKLDRVVACTLPFSEAERNILLFVPNDTLTKI